MTGCWILGVSVFGPGLPLWAQALPVLRGQAPWRDDRTPPPAPALLAPNERRRSGLAARVALAVCEEAVAMAGLHGHEVGAVFASGNGDGATVHGLLEALAGADGLLSPTQFHNSVHNAVAGYWSIGTGSQQPVTCLGCNDWTAAAALLKAAAETQAEARPTLLCLYDAPLPPPLDACRRTAFPFAAAFVLSPTPAPTAIARLHVRYGNETVSREDGMPRLPALRALFDGNAAARCLRLLEAVALGDGDRFGLELLDGNVEVEVAGVLF